MSYKICAGIVLYNPNLELLEENISAVENQVDELVLVDNTVGGATTEKIKEYHPKAHFIINKENLGIGKALNQILDFAKSGGYGWFITLDQDSVCNRNLMETYKKHLDDSIGQITCNIQDRSLGEIERKPVDRSSIDGLEEIESCITSGCINNTEALLKVGGYDESMFIDGVDIEVSLKLRQAGYRVMRLNYNGLTHSLGDGQQTRILGKKLSLTRHSPWRSYYMRRNFIYIARKYYIGAKKYKEIIKQIIYGLGTIIFEDKKIERIKYNAKGIAEGIKIPIIPRRQ